MKSTTLACCAVLILILFLLSIAKAISARRPKDFQKSTPYECGFDPYGSGRFPFSLHFFLMAILFVLFDLEIALIYPLATLEMGRQGTVAMVSSIGFLMILYLGLLHEWNEGSLEWRR